MAHQAQKESAFRQEKQAEVSDQRDTLEPQYAVMVYRKHGVTVAEDRQFRVNMIGAKANARLVKNTLAKRAVEGTRFAALAELFKGPTGIAYSADPVAPAKVIVEFAKATKDKVEIVGGILGDQILDANGAKALAALPSLDELRAKLVGMLQTPATRLAVVTKEPAAGLARIMSAKGNR